MYIFVGYILLQNAEAITPGIITTPYAVLFDALVPYLSGNQPKVHYMCTYV